MQGASSLLAIGVFCVFVEAGPGAFEFAAGETVLRVVQPDPGEAQGNVGVGAVAGTVRGEGKPLSGVLISDGRRVAQTDAAGKYCLETGPDSGPFVFVTIPSGFWTDEFYIPLKAAAASGRADFSLKRIEQPKRFDFVFLTDIHLENRGESIEKFRASLREIGRLDPKPAFVLCQGDICLQGQVTLPPSQRGHRRRTNRCSSHIHGPSGCCRGCITRADDRIHGRRSNHVALRIFLRQSATSWPVIARFRSAREPTTLSRCSFPPHFFSQRLVRASHSA